MKRSSIAFFGALVLSAHAAVAAYPGKPVHRGAEALVLRFSPAE